MVHPDPSLFFSGTWYIPTQYLNPGASLALPFMLWMIQEAADTETEVAPQFPEGSGSYGSGRAAEQRGELWFWCRWGSLCTPVCSSLRWLSFSVSAGEGAADVPGLVTCPSIPLALWQANSETHWQTDRGTVSYDSCLKCGISRSLCSSLWGNAFKSCSEDVKMQDWNSKTNKALLFWQIFLNPLKFLRKIKNKINCLIFM